MLGLILGLLKDYGRISLKRKTLPGAYTIIKNMKWDRVFLFTFAFSWLLAKLGPSLVHSSEPVGILMLCLHGALSFIGLIAYVKFWAQHSREIGSEFGGLLEKRMLEGQPLPITDMRKFPKIVLWIVSSLALLMLIVLPFTFLAFGS